MTTFAPLSFRDRIEKTPVIVRGRTGKTTTVRPDGGDGSAVFSITDLEVTEVLKGGLEAKSIQISQPGGEYRGVRTHVEGVANLTPDQDVVLFLTAGEKGVFTLPGMETGRYGVVADDSGEEILMGLGYAEGEKPWTVAEARATARGQGERAADARDPRTDPQKANSQTTEGATPTPQGDPQAQSSWSGPLLTVLGVLTMIGLLRWVSRRINRRPK